MSPSEAMALLLSDRRLFIETLIRIEDKDRKLVPFILNPIQSDMHETSSRADVYVKPAQAGGSTYFICDFLCDCITLPGTTAVIISYDEFITGRLLRKAQSIYDALKELIPSIPDLHHKSTYEKTFKRMNSSLYISSARGFAMPRGEPVHDLLLDEFAFWPLGAAPETFAATINRVPLIPGTKIKVVSTPNGEDNDFYEIYMSAKEGKAIGKSVFRHHFYPWYIHPEYSMPPDSEFVLPGDEDPILRNLDEDESNLMLRFEQMGIDYEEANNKIRWRRYKIAEMASLRRSGETRILFPQEFPEDDVSCFQSAGDMWYDADLINDMARKCRPASIHKLFADIWYDVEEELSYLVSIDPGLGKTSESVAHVWNFSEEEFRHCATLSGLYEDYDMAEKSKALAYYYNGAMIANEDTLGISSHLKDYPQLYYRTDVVSGKVSRKIGWETNKATKPFMCNELLRAMPKITTHDIRFVSQLRNIRDVGGRPTAVGADDHHDAGAIAIVCKDAVPTNRGLVGAAGWSEGWGEGR